MWPIWPALGSGLFVSDVIPLRFDWDQVSRAKTCPANPKFGLTETDRCWFSGITAWIYMQIRLLVNSWAATLICFSLYIHSIEIRTLLIPMVEKYFWVDRFLLSSRMPRPPVGPPGRDHCTLENLGQEGWLFRSWRPLFARTRILINLVFSPSVPGY